MDSVAADLSLELDSNDDGRKHLSPSRPAPVVYMRRYINKPSFKSTRCVTGSHCRYPQERGGKNTEDA
jgi:hypothetical protein